MKHAADERASADSSAVPVDRADFDRLAVVHRDRALRFAWGFLGDPHLAEDMVQEGLRRLYERRASYPLATHFGPYLVKIIARLCLDHRRKQDAEQRWRVAVGGRPGLATGEPAAEVHRQELAAVIAAAVGALPERERACFLLTVADGQSYRDAAEALALSASDVNNAVRRARLLLRQALAHLVWERAPRD